MQQEYYSEHKLSDIDKCLITCSNNIYQREGALYGIVQNQFIKETLYNRSVKIHNNKNRTMEENFLQLRPDNRNVFMNN